MTPFSASPDTSVRALRSTFDDETLRTLRYARARRRRRRAQRVLTRA
jgi:hypothetical protein